MLFLPICINIPQNLTLLGCVFARGTQLALHFCSTISRKALLQLFLIERAVFMFYPRVAQLEEHRSSKSTVCRFESCHADHIPSNRCYMRLKGIAISHEALRVAQRNKCWLCGRYMTYRKFKKSKKKHSLATKDHLICKSTYAGNKISLNNNSLHACQWCNNSRGCEPMDNRQRQKARMIHLSAIAYMLAI